MDGKVIFMTGATSGLGFVAAINMAFKGAIVIVMARNKSKGEALLSSYKLSHPNGKGKIEIVSGNLKSFKSLVKVCDEVKLKYSGLDQIVLNAGIMNFKRIVTEDNIEETLQVNLLSPLLLAHELLDLLKNSSDPKIIFTASGLHQGEINFEDLEFENGFSAFKVYRQSKLGVILACRLLARELKSLGIRVYCQHPGIVKTELGRNGDWFSKMVFSLMGKSPIKGAETLIYLMEKPSNELVDGEYYANKKVKKITPQSYDLGVAEKLLQRAKKYLKGFTTNSSSIFKNV